MNDLFYSCFCPIELVSVNQNISDIPTTAKNLT